MVAPTTLNEVLRAWFDAFGAGLRVSMPGRVESYDAAKRRASVQPLLRAAVVDSDGLRTVEALPLCQSVPVLFVGGGGGALTFPVRKGDVCELFFADESLDRWKSKGGEVDPGEVRPHDLSNAIAIVGLQDFASVTAAHGANVALLGPDASGGVHLKPNGEAHLGAETAADFVALAGAVLTQITNVANSLNALVSAFNTHVQPTPMGPTGVPLVPATPAAAPSSVAASKVKAT